MPKKYIKKSGKVLYTHKRIQLSEDTIVLPDGTESDYLLYDNLLDAVAIIAINSNDEILVNYEYNYPTDSYIYQFPAGTVESHEKPEDAATRELLEESGIVPSDLRKIGTVLHNHRRSNAKYHFFLTRQFEITNHDRENTELITNKWIPMNEFLIMVQTGKLEHLGSLAAWGSYLSDRLNSQT